MNAKKRNENKVDIAHTDPTPEPVTTVANLHQEVADNPSPSNESTDSSLSTSSDSVDDIHSDTDVKKTDMTMTTENKSSTSPQQTFQGNPQHIYSAQKTTLGHNDTYKVDTNTKVDTRPPLKRTRKKRRSQDWSTHDKQPPVVSHNTTTHEHHISPSNGSRRDTNAAYYATDNALSETLRDTTRTHKRASRGENRVSTTSSFNDVVSIPTKKKRHTRDEKVFS